MYNSVKLKKTMKGIKIIMKSKNSLLKNIIYTWKTVKEFGESKIYLLTLGMIIISVITPFLTTALPGTVVWLLVNKVYFLHTLFIIMAYALLLLILNYLNMTLNLNLKESIFFHRLKSGEIISHKILTTDFVNIDTPQKKTDIQKALNATYQNDDVGFPALITGPRDFIINILLLLLYTFFVARLNIWITLLLVISPILSLIAHSINIKWLRKNEEIKADIFKKINYLRTNSIDLKNGKDIRLYKIQNWFVDLYKNLLNLYMSWVNKELRRYFLIDLFERFITLTQNIVIYGYLLYNVMNDNMDIASFTLYLGFVSGIGGFINTAFKQFVYMQKNNIHVQNYLDYIRCEEFSNRGEGKKLSEGTTYELKLEDLSFKYPDSDENILEHLNLTIKKGEKIALVGENGAGKTTLVKILCGLYLPISGNLYIDNINSKDINIYDHYKAFSVIFQDIFPLAYSIAQNIACTFSENIDYVKLGRCIELAGLSEKVASLPDKEETTLLKIFDGIELSGGEMQKLMLARALYKNSPVMILDEPTAALDPIAESEMYEKYNTLVGGKTSIFISHRLSSTRFCDRILFMKDGKIIETGTHDELLSLGGEYSKMFEIQAHYYQKEVVQDV
jgi:ABC-type multidrug transport system fused ATPase/permease subunit